MKKIKLLLTGLGIDGWIFGLTALTAIIIGLLDFAPLFTLTEDPILRMALVAIGITMAALVAQTTRRSIEMRELRDTIHDTIRDTTGVTEVKLLGKEEFNPHAKHSIQEAKQFITDTSFTSTDVRLTHPYNYPQGYYFDILERLEQKEISYKRVEFVYNKERFEYVVSRLIISEGLESYIRYYDAPPQSVPLLNIMSIDDNVFYLGGFAKNSNLPIDIKARAFIKNSTLGELFRSYWSSLWHFATPLNDQKKVDWDKLKELADKLEVSETEFNAIVSKWKAEVQRQKRRRTNS